MKIIPLLFLLGMIPLVPFSYGWEFGGFVPGDVFEYDICDNHTLDVNTALRNKCYGVILHVVDIFEMDFGNVWLLYVEMIDAENDGDVMRDIILVDESFNVNSIYHKYIGDSIENTIFWMPAHAGMNDITLELGSVISGKFEDMVVTDFSREYSSTQYTLSSDSGDFIILRDDVYLPMSADINTSIVSFDIELNSMYNELEFGSVLADDVYSDYNITAPVDVYNKTSVSQTDEYEDNVIIINDENDDLIDSDISNLDTIESDDLNSDTIESDKLNSDTIESDDLNSAEIIIVPTDTDDSSNADSVVSPILSEYDVASLDDSKNDDMFGWLYDAFSFFESLISD